MPHRRPEVPHEIHGLPLPPALIAAMTTGRWRTPSSPALRVLFPEEPLHPCFYAPGHIQFENKDWPALAVSPSYLGLPSTHRPPGDIDPKRAILIGDLTVDKPIALDYRQSMTDPRVVYLADPPLNWVEIAPSISVFLDALGL